MCCGCSALSQKHEWISLLLTLILHRSKLKGTWARRFAYTVGAWTWVLQLKTISMLPTQSQTTNHGKSSLNKENERRINNHPWAGHWATSLWILFWFGGESWDRMKRGEERGVIRKQRGRVGGESQGGLRETGRSRQRRRQIEKHELGDTTHTQICSFPLSFISITF